MAATTIPTTIKVARVFSAGGPKSRYGRARYQGDSEDQDNDDDDDPARASFDCGHDEPPRRLVDNAGRSLTHRAQAAAR